MRIHCFQHVDFEGLGCIEEWIGNNYHQLSSTRFYETQELPDVNELDMLIVMGGPMGVYDEVQYPWLTAEKQMIGQMIEANKKVLGICLGAQLIADVLGAKVYANPYKEIGWYDIETSPNGLQSPILNWIEQKFTAFHWHGDTFDLPEKSTLLFSSEACRNQGFLLDNRVLGLQFHLEITAENLAGMLKNCQQELIDAPYIQNAETILKGTEIIEKNNQLMFRVLDRLSNG